MCGDPRTTRVGGQIEVADFRLCVFLCFVAVVVGLADDWAVSGICVVVLVGVEACET